MDLMNSPQAERVPLRKRFFSRGFLIFITFILFSLIFISLVKLRPVGHPNVLLITIDTLRADRLGCYGFTLARTPNIDGIAREGVRYSDAICVAPITLVSHTSILTGMNPPAHGVRDNGTYRVGDDTVTLADRLKSAGYATHAFVSAAVLNRRYNLSKGFDDYDDNLWGEDNPKLFMIRERQANKTIDSVLNWFNRWRTSRDRKPFFTWVHLFDPHQPYRPPSWARILAPSPYDGEIAFADQELGRLFSALRQNGVMDNTIVVITADHGESLGEHDEKTHAIFIYDATVHVPLIIRFPRLLPTGSVYRGPVRSIDIVPTLLSILGVKGAEETQGVNLVPATLGKIRPPDLPQYSESRLSELGFGMAPLYGLRKGGHKWIRAPKPEVYDLKADPQELVNIYDGNKTLAAELDEELGRIMEKGYKGPASDADNPMNRETLDMLQSLGYLASSEERRSMSGMDPKDGIAIYNDLEEARHLAQQGRLKESEAQLNDILRSIPKHVSARNILGFVLMKQNRLAEARRHYLQSLRDDPKQARVFVMLGYLALSEGNFAEAERRMREGLAISPQFVEAASGIGFIEDIQGNAASALSWYEKAVSMDPHYPLVYRRIADFHYDRKDFSKALRYYEKSLERLPGDFRSLIQAGNSARRLSDMPKGRQYYERAAKLRPDSWIPRYNMACLKSLNGDVDGALVALREAVGKGLPSKDLLRTDGDLKNVRSNRGFGAIVAAVRPGGGDDSE